MNLLQDQGNVLLNERYILRCNWYVRVLVDVGQCEKGLIESGINLTSRMQTHGRGAMSALCNMLPTFLFTGGKLREIDRRIIC